MRSNPSLHFIFLLTLLATLLPPLSPAYAAPGQPPDVPGGPLPPAMASPAQAAEATPVPQPETPRPFLARLTADADPQALAEFLRELREQDQIGEFRWVEESRAFLIMGEKGLALVIARPEVHEILEATPETLALPPLQDETPPEQPESGQPITESAPEEQPESGQPMTESAPAEQPGPNEMPQEPVQEPQDIYLVQFVAPQSIAEVGTAYERLRFELDYLYQQEQIGTHEWLPEANAVRVEIIVPQAIDFLERLSDVEEVLPYTEETLEQVQAGYRAALRALHRG
ncbi:MAG: hypothetical protein N2508_06020, partial [Anaerolineae bacterium]|nr:hypothetical protein [Anaerolineae bacterium]